MTISDRGLLSSGPWPQGINNLAKEGLLPGDENGNILALREASNVDVSAEGQLSRRQGYTQILPGTLSHSLWSHLDLSFGLFVDDGQLCVLHQDESADLLGLDVGHSPMSYALVGDRIYFSNGNARGMLLPDLSVADWAPAQPDGQPTLEALDEFGLDPGQYQVAITFTDALGRESGNVLAAAMVDIAAGGGIAVRNIPQPAAGASVARINVYVTGPNDQVLRLAAAVSVGTQQMVIGLAAAGRSLPESLQYTRPLPAGSIVRKLGGRLLVVVGQEVLISEPQRFGQFHPVRSRLRFAAKIDLLEPIGDGDGAGFYVAAGARTYWMSAGTSDPAQASQQIVQGVGAIPGSGLVIDAKQLGFDQQQPVVTWIARNGKWMAGLPGGMVTLLRDGAVVDAADSAAVLYREENGIQQLVATMRGTRRQGLAVNDLAVAHYYPAGSEEDE